MSNATVRVALETRLKRIASTLNPVPPIAYQNAAFEKPTSGVWLECFVIPSATVDRGVQAQSKTYLGMFQINVWIQRGIGMGAAESIVDKIIAGFPSAVKDQKYAKLTISGVSEGASLDDTSGWVATPVLVTYRYDS